MKSIPDYSSSSRTDLLDETTKIATRRAEALTNAAVFDDRLKARLAALDAQYHAAYAALLDLTHPFDAHAAERLEVTRAWHRAEYKRHVQIALGTERLIRHGDELQQAVS